jgi:hypothetical protein
MNYSILILILTGLWTNMVFAGNEAPYEEGPSFATSWGRPSKPLLPIPTPTIISEKGALYKDPQGTIFATYSWFSQRGLEFVSFFSSNGDRVFSDQYFYGSTQDVTKCEIVRYRSDGTVYGRAVPCLVPGGPKVFFYNAEGSLIPPEVWAALR